MADHDRHILNFSLFGDQGDLPDVVHVETIETRSRLHDWEFAPHRHGSLHQVLLVQKGGGQAGLDGHSHPLSDMTIANVPIGIVHEYTFEEGTTGRVVTLASEMLDESLRRGEGLWPVLMRPGVVAARGDVVETIARIEAAFAGRSFGRAHVLRALCSLLLGQIGQCLAESSGADGQSSTPALLARLGELIDRHFHEHWSVADYAGALAVTPTHLSRIAREATGKPASKLIEERLVREARRHLVYTNLPVSTIAYELGFDDPAYFSRVFARATGQSPRAFRASR